MPTQDTEDKRLLSPLSFLAAYPLGFQQYYGQLFTARDEILKVGALCAMLEIRPLRTAHWPEIVELSKFGAIRKRAFDFFEKNFEYEWAEKVLLTRPISESDVQTDRMRAGLALDSEGLHKAQIDLFMATGDVAHLHNATDYAEEMQGWKTAAESAVRVVLLRPMDMNAPGKLLHVLLHANKLELMDEVCDTLDRLQILRPVSLAYRAAVYLRRGDARGALKLIQSVPKGNLPRVLELSTLTMRAEAYEKLQEYREAYRWYGRMNKVNFDKDIDASNFARDTVGRGELPVPELPADTRDNICMMLGFPRSGTTLLENSLAAHPLIETFEEIPSMQSAYQYIGWQKTENGNSVLSAPQTYVEARRRFYLEIDRRRRKPDATCLVDKMPIRAAEVKFIEKLFPEQKFIFSIRHPFDVVLSCFKQSFKPNVAMQNFVTIADGVRVYDFVMSRWFDVHTMDDPNVHYIRYDDLVTDFESEMRGVCGFLGVPWDESVKDFARAAEARKVQTPSYQKVRSGLSIGVQSSWEKYRFVFESAEAKPLYKWAEFFGYETK